MSDSSTISRDVTPVLEELTLYHFDEDLKTYKSIDLKKFFVHFHIYMSIHSPLTTGDISLREEFNFLDWLPIDGKEIIKIRFFANNKDFNSKNEAFDRIFFVFALDHMEETLKNKTYTLRFVDILGVINTDMRYSYGYDNEEIETIFRNVFDFINKTVDKGAGQTNPNTNYVYKELINNELFKSYFKDGSEYNFARFYNDMQGKVLNKLTVTFTVDKPLEVLQKVASVAVSTFNEQIEPQPSTNYFCDCLMFQNRSGQIVFTNYFNMIVFNLQRQSDGNEIIFEKKVQKVAEEKRVIPETEYNIESYTITDFMNYQQDKIYGLFGAVFYTIDFSNPTIFTQLSQFDYKDLVRVFKIQDINLIMKKYTEAAASCFQWDDKYPKLEYKRNITPFKYKESFIALTLRDTQGISISQEHHDDFYNQNLTPSQNKPIITTYLERYTLTLNMNGCQNIDLGKRVKIDMHAGQPSDVTEYKIDNYIQEVPWIVSSVSHVFTADLQFKTCVQCFSPYFKSKSEKSAESSATN